MRRWIIAIAALLLSVNALAVTETWQFKDATQEQTFHDIISQLRCPKCQNNSVADSNAMIAADMRQKVYQLLQQGQSKQQIIDYMVARYGNFVRYDPPLTPGTLVLWLLPALFILGGAAVVVMRTRRPQAASGALSEEERQRLASLLEKEKTL